MLEAVKPSTTQVLFIGTGAIGLPMAVRVARAGHHVTAVDRSQDRRREAERKGLRTASAPTPADIAVVMVASGDQLTHVVEDEGGLVHVLPRGSVCVVMSTVGPDAVRAATQKLTRHGIHVVDAPVTGGLERAGRGELTILAAGSANAMALAADVLNAMGSVHPCGHEPGDGQSMKLVNQLLCSVHLVAAAEALAFAEALGLDPRDVHRAISTGAGASFMFSDRGSRMIAAEDSEDGITALDIFVKDSALVRDAATGIGSDVPLLDVAADAFTRAATLGLGRSDDSRVRDVYK
ncbi:hypothetical protein ASG56_06250 [Rhodococcus sp. Leaf7]|nr:hypothetical protein ASG56_06250 [Rhodococcus sp. Leaf7]KQU42659.1 hypothetical protein ASG64_06250 [Rhodococcus sp. Leaf247]